MTLGDSIVWFASYPRSGNTWLRFLVSSAFFGETRDWSGARRAVDVLHQRLAQAESVGLASPAALHRIRVEQEQLPRDPSLPRDLLIKTHFTHSERHPFIERTRRAVLLVRHPEEVLLSAISYRLLTGGISRENVRERAMAFARSGGDPHWLAQGFGTWASHAESWMSAGGRPVLVVRYERLRVDPHAELRRILRFLGARLGDDRIEAAVRDCSKGRLRALELRARAAGEFPVADPSRTFIGRPPTLGRLEDLGGDVVRAFEDRFGSDLERLGYPLRAVGVGGGEGRSRDGGASPCRVVKSPGRMRSGPSPDGNGPREGSCV